ncbi:MAG: polymer-forming cytoskeletal protein [Candidatus Acidiferrales bacterium]
MPLGWFKKGVSEEWTGFLDQGVKLDGTLETVGTIRLDCSMKGRLVSGETLILGEQGVMSGEIEGNLVIVGGRFDGTIRAKGKVELQAKAIVTGEIYTPCLIMEQGAVFDGRCHMLAPAQAAKPITIPIRSAAARA